VRERLRRTAISAGVMLAGFCVLLVDQRLEVGRWNAYFLVQRKYHHTLRDPLAPVHDALHVLRTSSPFRVSSAPSVQTLLVTFALVCVLVVVATRRRSDGDLLLALWALATWAFPLAQANVSVWRSEAALLPLAALMPRLPRPLLVVVVVVAGWISVPMAMLYFEGKLV
jgi:hypothetical protein